MSISLTGTVTFAFVSDARVYVRDGVFIVGKLISGLSSPGSSPVWGHCVVF